MLPLTIQTTHMKYILLTLTTALLWVGCAEEPVTTMAELEGDWKGIEIKQNGSVQNLIDFSFKFNTDSTYTYKGGSYKEKGVYSIQGNKLITHAEGDLEKQVEITKIANDTLVLNMNDAGTAMIMTLLHQ